MTREVIFGVTLPIVLPIFWGLDGIIFSFPIADILTFVIAAAVIRMTYRELGKTTEITSYLSDIVREGGCFIISLDK